MLYEVRTAWFVGDQTSWSGPRGPSHLFCQSLAGGACGAQWVAILQAVDAAGSARTGKYLAGQDCRQGSRVRAE